MSLNNKTTRIAGLLYLITAISGIFATVVRSKTVVTGDALATANNIMSSDWLFRMGIMSDFIMMTFYLLLALTLYSLLKHVNKKLSSLFVIFTMISVSIMCLNMLNQFAPILLLSGADYLKVFEEEQLHALVLIFLSLHKYGYLISQIFFALWLLPLGYVVLKSGYFPKFLGVLLMIACFGHLVEFFIMFLFPGYEVITYPALTIAAIGEFTFMFWLLFKRKVV